MSADDVAADPFGTAGLRAGVLAAWRDSPTRLREDAATESDLVRAGYRDRLLTELAQNAADAAAKAGAAGRVVVRIVEGDVHISNTGAPLDLAGVHALTALRASGKADPTASVGRFGVGFTAVRTVSDEIEVRSTTGSLRFSRDLTWEALRDNAITVPGPAETFTPPVLRLAWPIEAAPPAAADTEIVLRLRSDIDPESLLAAMRAEAVDLLLELPALQSIRIGDAEFTRTEADLSARRSAGLGLRELRIDGPGSERRVWWEYRTARARWLLPLRDGRPASAAHDVLRAPTRSDEELSLPALLIADIPMQPDRRRVLPGARIAEFAEGYADFARALPSQDRLVLVPTPGFARSEVDGMLREALIRELQTHPWLPVVAARPKTSGEMPEHSGMGSADSTVDESFSRPEAAGSNADRRGVQADVSDTEDWTAAGLPGDARSAALQPLNDATAVPTRASVFTGLSWELADLLDDIVGPLVVPELSGRAHSEALGVLDVHRLGLARLAELSGSLERSPKWWRSLYAALEPYVVDPLAAEELGALAVPLADGRLVTGPRTAILDDQLDVAIPVHWARLVHPEAVHPLLARLGARSAAAEDLLSDPGLRAELEDQQGDPDTTDAVLRLAAQADPSALPSWLGLLELPDTTGELLPADELLLPDAPLSALLVPDSPFGTVATDLVDRYGAEALRAVGVGWDFSVVVESDPTGPDHHLDDEELWWSGLPEDPPELAAVRDLDLVDEPSWPAALRQLASSPRTRELLTDPEGYTAWWLRRHARVNGTPLGLLRHPTDTEFADLLPEFEYSDPDSLRAVLANPNAITQELAAALLAALADPSKTPTPEVVSRTHARLAAAVDHLDLTELELPERVRALSSAVVDPNEAWVLDQPWFGLAVPADHLVAGDTATAPALATLLDLPMVSEVITAEVTTQGRHTTWSAEPLGIILRQLFTIPTDGDLVLHDTLRIRLRGALEATIAVPWWRQGTTTHIQTPHSPARLDE
ncbi:sacsin N-terminal ATP-binding-like domain-containing protein [Nocardia sp. NPDC050630]|uniref:sacsin N-terminal ATP-binding-like domain-containing protein n=1 Tax=Nocardia sp. NPDC050630 TaxID=3364321 RepID=UPI00378C484E